MRPVRRIALFAGHDPNGTIPAYVVHLVRHLSRFADVFYCCDNALAAAEGDKLQDIATLCGAARHECYDFGSWAKIVATIGWDRISAYDEMIIVNDSCYGPFHDLAPICDEMSQDDCDFWGITENAEISRHIQSYFCVFKHSVLISPAFRSFWDTIEREGRYEDIVAKYEVGLSRLLFGEGFVGTAYIRTGLHENITIFPLTTLIACGMPFIKVKCFRDPYIGSRERISALLGHIRRHHRDLSGMIATHLGKGFIGKAIVAQKLDQPIYFNLGIIRMRSIRGDRLKIWVWNRWRIIIRLNPALMKRLSRWQCLHVRIAMAQRRSVTSARPLP